ncbi:E3 UFM1-protein ligase 1 homolog [Condylostylus longicornis]|uniref:E3 UFM1-protein ligase 1 homolog n=1 Tax=Condylostylus longicornis TaxID=2530218 RepID=UPI00244DE6E9|nr:E3 UFM1-protein ligase 1 homolog [Condylostylus longicornis]
MSSNWDEIKRLASDFQKVQSSSNLQRLSERNCVEIVTLLIEKKLINVVFTTDGKEYITPEHLERETLDELYVHGGRINLVELSKILNVDLSKLNDIGEKIVKEDDSIHFMLGQFITETYIETIAHEINEKLAAQGEISVSDLTLQFDLPSEFLQTNVVEKHLGGIIKGRQDPGNPRVFFTQAYIQRCRAKIRGALTAITQPISVSAILQHINVPEKIFYSLCDEFSSQGTFTSKQINAQYIPHIYSKMQVEWVTSFYSNNGFLEYEAVSKLGISDAKQFIKKVLPNEEMMFLKNCVVGSKIIDLTVISALNECNATKSYVDLSTILPSNIDEEDIEELFNAVMSSKHLSYNFVFIENTVFSSQYLTELIEPCIEISKKNAKESVDSGQYQAYIAAKQLSNRGNSVQEFEIDSKTDKRDERRKKAAAGKAGGGSQGRETKTKSTKKHRGGADKSRNNDSEEDEKPLKVSNKVLELVKLNEIEKCIKPKLEEEGLEDLRKHIAKLYYADLNQKALVTAQTLFESTPQTNRRQTHSQLQDRINTLLNDIRLYEKGLKLLPHDTQTQLVKYLLKSLGNDICNELVVYAANECNVNVKNPANLNIDQRNKIIQECDAEYKTALLELNKSLNKTLEEFLEASDIALKACSMITKKIDKKRDRLLMHQHKEKLIEQIKDTEDPALILHLSTLILFSTVTGCILHASGRFVSQILSFLKPNFNDEQNKNFMEFHDLVLKYLSVGGESEEGKIVFEQLKSLENSIRDFAINYEKPGTVKAD